MLETIKKEIRNDLIFSKIIRNKEDEDLNDKILREIHYEAMIKNYYYVYIIIILTSICELDER